MKRASMLLAGLLAVLGLWPEMGIAPAQAQMDWLTPNLESQRYNNLRQHQQSQRSNRQKTAQPRISPQRRQQLMRQIEPEYRRRVRMYGKARANEWLKRTAWRIGVEEGRRARNRRR